MPSGGDAHGGRKVVMAMVLGAAAGSRMAISMVSFGYKYCARAKSRRAFIPNPFFVPDLRPLDGTDPRVRNYVMA
jgi:UPF0042 nucleotide-binding protein